MRMGIRKPFSTFAQICGAGLDRTAKAGVQNRQPVG